MRGFAAPLAALLVLMPGVALAGDFARNPHIGAAEHALDSGALDQAWSELQAALADPDNSDDELVEIYRLQGIVALYQGNRDEARRALVKLFQARPDYQLPRGTAPKIRELFAEVQADVRAHRVKPVTLEFTPLQAIAAGGPATIQAQVKDLPDTAHVRFFYRRVGSEAYGALDLRAKGALASGTLPAAELPLADAPFALEYYVEVDDAAGRRLAGHGDALSPLTVRVHAPDSGLAATPAPQVETAPRWYQHWYTWVAIGAVVVAGGATTYYLLSRPSTGSLPLQVTFQ